MNADHGTSVSTVQDLAPARMTSRVNFAAAADQARGPRRIAGRPHPKGGPRLAPNGVTHSGYASWSPPTHVRYRTAPAAVTVDPPTRIYNDDDTIEFELPPYDAEPAPRDAEPAPRAVEDRSDDVEADELSNDIASDGESELSIFTFAGSADVDERRRFRLRGRTRGLFSHH
jgi:hypothetical protein